MTRHTVAEGIAADLVAIRKNDPEKHSASTMKGPVDIVNRIMETLSSRIAKIISPSLAV